jgi:hypothetical protein
MASRNEAELLESGCRNRHHHACRNDKEFSELELRMTIAPHQVRWPAPEYLHWQRLHEAVNEARERVSKAYAQMDEVDQDAGLPAPANTASAVRLRKKRLPILNYRKR